MSVSFKQASFVKSCIRRLEITLTGDLASFMEPSEETVAAFLPLAEETANGWAARWAEKQTEEAGEPVEPSEYWVERHEEELVAARKSGRKASTLDEVKDRMTLATAANMARAEMLSTVTDGEAVGEALSYFKKSPSPKKAEFAKRAGISAYVEGAAPKASKAEGKAEKGANPFTKGKGPRTATVADETAIKAKLLQELVTAGDLTAEKALAKLAGG